MDGIFLLVLLISLVAGKALLISKRKTRSRKPAPISELWQLDEKEDDVQKVWVKDDEAWPFYAKKLLTKPEQILYFRLVEALPDYVIFSQVQLSVMLGVKGWKNYGWLNRINRMSSDFVVCSRQDFTIIAAIELDDSSHGRPERQAADRKKDKALTVAGIHIIRWHVRNIPTVQAIRNSFSAISH
jgi:hypothetical protein